MSDFNAPVLSAPSGAVLTTADGPVGDVVTTKLASMTTSTAWGTANLIKYYPVLLTVPMRVERMAWVNGATVAGNVCAGVYSEKGTQLCATASTAQAGVSVVQSAAVSTPILLPPGCYYLAFVSDSTTATFGCQTGINQQNVRMVGCLQQTLALPLPATWTPVSFTTNVNVNQVAALSKAVAL